MVAKRPNNILKVSSFFYSIIEGDNQQVLKKLSGHLQGEVKCIYIDPPYNNGEKHYHYADSKIHEKWISEISNTLSLLWRLLSEEGSIWISIDDQEMHYLKVAADKVFGRKNYVHTIIWQQRTTRENRTTFSNNHEYILVYAKNPRLFKKTRNSLPLTEEVLSRYKNPDNDPRGPWQSISANVQSGHGTKHQYYEIVSPFGVNHIPPKGRCWCYDEERMKKEIKENNIWFGKDGKRVPRIKKFLSKAKKGLTPETLWLGKEAGTNKMAKKHLLNLLDNEKVFDTPKPEELIGKILSIATDEGDLVLDCYLGSGTTISTAHKMNRRYIGIEKDPKIISIAQKRLDKVIDGEQGGISKIVGWKGGGPKYNFYRDSKFI